MPFPTKKRQGFTLIELLVVISIISLLVSILLPSLSSAREMAQALQCSTNLKQIGVGFQVYADTNRDYMPASTIVRSPNNFIDLLGNSGAVGGDTHWTHYSGGTTYPRMKNWKVFWDPAEKPYNDEPNSMYTTASVVWHNRAQDFSYGSSYSMNWSVSNYEYGRLRKGWNKGPETSHWWNRMVSDSFNPMQLTTPSTAPIMMDGPSYYLHFTDDSDRYGPDSPFAGAPHYYWPRAKHSFRHPGGTANVLYMDGHVSQSKHMSVSGTRVWRFLWADPPPLPQ